MFQKTDRPLNFLEKLFRTEIRPKIESYVQGELDGPLIIEFDPTTACNYECPECISADLLNKEKIPSKRIEALIQEFALAGVVGIIFIGGGEPLAHSCMPKPIRQAYYLKMAIGLTTNGSLVDRYLETISEYVSWTRVSVDAATEETYLLFRPNKIKNSFSKVIKNMEALAKSKKGRLGFSFLIMQRPGEVPKNSTLVDEAGKKHFTNAFEMYEAAKIARNIGCDYFEYKPMVDFRHHLLPFNKEIRLVVKEQHERCKQLQDDNFKVIAPRSIEHLYSKDAPLQPKQYETCPTMELRTCVTPSGIYPCPYHRGRDDKKLGTIHNGPFHKLWKSNKRKEAMMLTNPKHDCEFYCNRHSSNLILNTIKEVNKEGIRLLDYIGQVEGLNDPFF